MCASTYVDFFARAGQLEKACNTFEKMLTYQLGAVLRGDCNYRRIPQAFTHLARLTPP